MSITKMALALALGTLAAQAFADDGSQTLGKAPVEYYSYGSHLDIQKVVSHSVTPDQCGAVPVQMTYEDSKGQRHTLEYLVMGECSNG